MALDVDVRHAGIGRGVAKEGVGGAAGERPVGAQVGRKGVPDREQAGAAGIRQVPADQEGADERVVGTAAAGGGRGRGLDEAGLRPLLGGIHRALE
ncbi:MAG: hypothetical protein ACK559_34770, partial [bacterium]